LIELFQKTILSDSHLKKTNMDGEAFLEIGVTIIAPELAKNIQKK